MIVAS